MDIKRLSWLACATLAAFAAALLPSGCILDEAEEQLPPGEVSDLSVDQLVEKMSSATDPEGKFKNAKSYILKQKVEDIKKTDRQEYSLEIKFKAPDFMKFTSFNGGKAFSTLIFDGSRAWNIDPLTGRSSEVPDGTNMNLVKTFAALTKPGSTIKTVFEKVDIDVVKDEQTGSRSYRLVCCVKDPAIAPYIIYVGKDDFLTKKFETTLYGADGSQSKYLSETKKYTWMDGVRMGSETTVQTTGDRVNTTVVSFVLNPEIPDSEFKPPVPWYEKAEAVEAGKGK